MKRQREEQGFTLIELMIAMALGLVVAGVAMQGLFTSGRSGERMALQMRERTFQRRALALLRSELAAAKTMELGTATNPACNLEERTPVVHLMVEGKPITYTVGAAPSGIWRGQVLMRCGPAYLLEGGLSADETQNEVVLDGLPTGGLEEEEEEMPGLVRMTLKQEFPLRGEPQPLKIESEMGAPAPPPAG
jgi:prepilin-type N-terminal cleavage/methylation domain-containing protein